jgi:hypothetical protein
MTNGELFLLSLAYLALVCGVIVTFLAIGHRAR